MKLVTVDYTYDGRKAIFYFTAENRVDFRDLVRDLANTLRVRVEMKQIGARDETKVPAASDPAAASFAARRGCAISKPSRSKWRAIRASRSIRRGWPGCADG